MVKSWAILRRINRNQDPRRFFTDLKMYRALGIDGLVDRARAMAASPTLLRKDATMVLDVLSSIDEPEWRDVARIVARRYIEEPAESPQCRCARLSIARRVANVAAPRPRVPSGLGAAITPLWQKNA